MEPEDLKKRIRSVISLKYEPVFHQYDADLELTTLAVVEKISLFSGMEISSNEVFALMESLNFIYAIDDHFDFVWLLKERVL